MTCCRNNGTFLSRSFDDFDSCCSKRQCCDGRGYSNYNDDHDYECYDNKAGISCPNINNNDCSCADSLREVACRLTNQRSIIHVEGCKMCVVIVSIGKCFIKAINPCTQKIIYFNLNRIDNIEDVLPRCYY